MSKINILHVSDLHYKGKSSTDQNIVLDSFLRDVEKLKGSVDLIIFSGDLVHSGQDESQFDDVFDKFVDPTIQALDLDRSRFFICPGNHDIDRENVRNDKYNEIGLKNTLINRDEINIIFDRFKESDVFSEKAPAAFSRLENFYRKVWATEPAPTVFTPFSSIRKITINDIEIGVCCFNSSWRCTGEPDDADRNQLIIGERTIDHAIEATKDVAIRFAVFHHPLDWLLEADRSSIDFRLHQEFDAFFFGHVHNAIPSFTKQPMGGAIVSQAGCLYASRNYFNGYSLIDMNVSEGNVKVQLREYSDRTREFIPALAAIPGGEVTFSYPFEEGTGDGNIMALLAVVRPGIRKLGDDHVRLAGKEDGTSATFEIEKHFVCPPLSQPKRSSDNFRMQELGDKYSVDEILNCEENIVLLGPPESGKTAVLHYIACNVIDSSSESRRLPLWARFEDFKRGDSAIWRAVRAYANEISDGRIKKKHINSVPILLLVDEVNFSENEKLEFILDLVDSRNNIKVILASSSNDYHSIASVANRTRLDKFHTVCLSELPRTSIRELVAQWVQEDVESEFTNEVFNKVMDHLRKSGLPRSGYIVSLILWTISQNLSNKIINEAVLLENLVDFMLNKMDYSGSLRSEFDFASKIAVLQEVTFNLRNVKGSISKNQLTSIVIEFLTKKGLNYDAAKIVNGFIQCGVFTELDDIIYFRYRRFEDYFAAGYLRDNSEVLSEVLSLESWGSLDRVMDIYTSRYRGESYLLDEAFEKLSCIDVTHSSMTEDELIEYIEEGANPELALHRLEKMKKEPMTARKIDELQDRAEAEFGKKVLEYSELSEEAKKSNTYLRLARFIESLNVYTQFIRNLEFADLETKETHFDLCIELWSSHTKGILGAVKKQFEVMRTDIQCDTKFSDEETEELVEVSYDIESHIKYSVPLVVSSILSQSIGTEKLSVIIESCAKNTSLDPIMRLLAVFVYMDIHPIKAVSLINSSGWEKTMNAAWIDSAIESKLYQYYRQQPLSGKLKNMIQELIVSLQSRIEGSKSIRDYKKSKVLQSLKKSDLISATKN